MKRYVYLLSVVLALMMSATVLSQTAKPVNPAGESKPVAPAFNVTSIEGKRFDLAALSGKVVVLNFWFAGCKPCVEEMPELNRLVDKYRNKEVVFIAPTWDDLPTVQAFLKEHRFKYYIVPDASDLIVRSYGKGTGTIAFPKHILIDREGKIDTIIEGPLKFDDLRKTVARLANAPFKKAK